MPDTEPRSLPFGRVVSTDGAPVAEARVRWVAFRREEVELDPAWRQEDWGPLPVAFEERVSGADGAFAFDVPPGELTHGSALVVTHLDHVATGVALAVDPMQWPGSIELVMAPGAPVDVQVVDAAGQPVPAARVQHHGLAADLAPRGEGRSILSRLIWDEGLTGADGHLQMAPFPGEQAFQAFQGDTISPPYRAVEPTSVQLTLGDSFLLVGTATMPAWDEGFVGERRLLISARERHVWRTVAALRSVPDGAFGPVPVPLGNATHFRVRLEGSPIMPVEREFARPNAGETVRFDVVAERGAAIWLEVTDTEGSPVPNAIGEARWEDPDAPGHYRSMRMGGKPNGRLSLWSFPPGNVSYQVTAPGHGTATGSVDLPSDHGYTVVLERAGTLEGRCTHAGKPVEDFALTAWRAGPAPEPSEWTFVGRKDGRFRIEGLLPGDWNISAASEAFPGAAPSLVTVEADTSAHVDIELPTPVLGHGRVVRAGDGASADAVPGAWIQPFSAGTKGRLAPWGPETRAQPDGRFEMAAFVTGVNYLTVGAPGHAPREVEAVAKPGEPLDWGDIALHPTQRLRVELVGCPGPPGEYTASAFGPTPLVRRPFPANGVIEYDDVGPGRFKFFAERDSGDWVRLDLDLRPGEDWDFECPVGGETGLRVRLVSPGEPPDFDTAVALFHQDVSGPWVMRYRTSTEPEVVFSGLRCLEAEAVAFDPRSQPVARGQATLVPGEENLVELHLDEAPLRIHVLDPEGAPVDNAWVVVREADGTVFGSDDTDMTGWAHLRGVPGSTVLVDVSHQTLGRRIGVALDASVREAEVLLEAGGRLELHVHDGAMPLSEVSVSLEAAPGLPLGEPAHTDGSGQVVFEPIGAGDYRFALRRHDCWPIEVGRTLVADEEARLEVTMRRLVSAELTLVSAEGFLVVDEALVLHSIEFDTDVRAWIDAGRITAPNGVRTDSRGRLRLEGLPSGEYRWSSEATSGTIVLEPGEAQKTLQVR